MKKNDNSQFSKEHLEYLRLRRQKNTFITCMRVFVLVFLLFAWEILTKLEVLDSFMFSSPIRILKMTERLLKDGTIWGHMFTTLLECMLGFIIATILGIIIAVLLWWNKTLQQISEPYIIVLNSLPKVALGPIIIIWAGVGLKSIIVMCVLISVIVTILSVLSGFSSVDPNKLLLLESMGANRLQILTKLMIPFSIPNFISIMKMNIGLAWVGTIMGEYLSSKKGLGYLILYGGQVFQIDLVMTAIVILCILATGMYLLISLMEKLLAR